MFDSLIKVSEYALWFQVATPFRGFKLHETFVNILSLLLLKLPFSTKIRPFLSSDITHQFNENVAAHSSRKFTFKKLASIDYFTQVYIFSLWCLLKDTSAVAYVFALQSTFFVYFPLIFWNLFVIFLKTFSCFSLAICFNFY